MLYLKVKPEADQFVINKNFDILIANELYTVKEFEKMRAEFLKMGGKLEALENKFELVDISRKKTYWFFGARFSDDTGGDTLPF